MQEKYIENLERQVVLADSQVCIALLTLLQQELTGYMRGGWMLRKAWRSYQHTYNQILQLHRRTFGNNPSGFHSMCSIASLSDTSPSSETAGPRPGPDSSPSGLRSSLSMLFSFAGLTTEPQTP